MDQLDLQVALESIAHELDMLVFAMETTPHNDLPSLLSEHARLRRDLERLHEQLIDLIRSGRFT